MATKKKTNNFNGPHENSARCHICIDFVLMALQLEERKAIIHNTWVRKRLTGNKPDEWNKQLGGFDENAKRSLIVSI